MTVILIGPHGVGKTCLGLAVSVLLGVPFHGELGREMAEDPSWRAPGGTAEDEQGSFDEALFAAELRRDAGWSPGRPRIIETWHPGNLAYARVRSPHVARRFQAAVRAACSDDVVVQPLVAPAHVLAGRQSEPGDLDFFLRVGLAATAEARALGLAVLAPMDTHRHSPGVLAHELARRVASSRIPSHRAGVFP